MPVLRMPDGTTVNLPEGEPVGSALAPSVLAARVDGGLRDLSFVPDHDGSDHRIGGCQAKAAMSEAEGEAHERQIG